MIQDRSQKQAALRYAVGRGWLPQLELDVSTFVTTGRRRTNITDIDVFASVQDDTRGFQSILIDCKTRKGESPITRALWQKGLMDRMGAGQGICILRIPRIEADHRYTAAQLGITLLTESEFPAYAKATGGDVANDSSMADIDLWDSFFAIGTKYPDLESAIRFSRSSYWMSESDAEACTRTIFLLAGLRRELDPSKPEHLAVVADLACLFCHALARIVASIFPAYLQPENRSELSWALLYLLYGGRGTYDHLNRIKKLIVESRSTSGETNNSEETTAAPVLPRRAGEEQSRSIRRGDLTFQDLSLPEWDRFVELVRQTLDAPLQLARSSQILREIAFACLDAKAAPVGGITKYSRQMSASAPQGARFAVLAVDYLSKAGRLPREFNDILGSRLLAAQARS